MNSMPNTSNKLVSDGENEERRIEKHSKDPSVIQYPLSFIKNTVLESLELEKRLCLQMIGLEWVYCLDIVLKEDCI